MAVLAPIPIASESTMTRVSPGLLSKVRNPKRKSERIERIFLLGRSLRLQVSIPHVVAHTLPPRTPAPSVHSHVSAFPAGANLPFTGAKDGLWREGLLRAETGGCAGEES